MLPSSLHDLYWSYPPPWYDLYWCYPPHYRTVADVTLHLTGPLLILPSSINRTFTAVTLLLDRTVAEVTLHLTGPLLKLPSTLQNRYWYYPPPLTGPLLIAVVYPNLLNIVSLTGSCLVSELSPNQTGGPLFAAAYFIAPLCFYPFPPYPWQDLNLGS